VRGKTEHKLTN